MTYSVINDSKFGPICVSMICKNGTQTLADYTSNPRLKNEDSMHYDVRVGIIQHPRIRFNAGWSFYNRLLSEKSNNNDVPPEKLNSYEEYVDYTLEVDDIHWMPQKPTLMIGDFLTATHVIRFEDLAGWWPQLCKRELVHINWAPNIPTSYYRTKELDEVYGDDYALWADAIGYYPGKRL